MTPDQKKALWIGGGIVAVIVLYLATRTQGIPTAIDVKPAGVMPTTGVPPGYTSYNVQPLSMPSPGVSPTQDRADYSKAPAIHGCGCNTKSDGCFTSNGIDTGQAPLSLTQLIADYGAGFPEFLNLVQSAQSGYAVESPTILEITRNGCYGSINSLYSGNCNAPSVNGY